MKAGHPIHIDRAREKDPPGGVWEKLDPVARGRVQILPAGGDPVSQARTVMAELRRLAALSPDWDWSRCAVIAREWEYLVPVLAYCEALEIPAQMGERGRPGILAPAGNPGVSSTGCADAKPGSSDGGSLRGWTESRPSGPWDDLLRQAVEEHALETGGGETPVDHFIEWLAEWGRDMRRRQHGLLLLTGHSAKGLEFDHVAVLDGGWNRIGRGEDPDESRRLYYVAMTRARQTLALAHCEAPHRLQDALCDNPSVVRREAVALPPASSALLYRHVRTSLKEVDLGFAGRLAARHTVHRAIAVLSSGDPLEMRSSDRGRWELLDRGGNRVGRLAKSFNPPPGMRCRSAAVLAMVGRTREMSEPEYRDSIRCESWEVVVPELVFEPEDRDIEG